MAITKTDFYNQDLNQFAPGRVRGEYLDWGLNALVLDVQIDASEDSTLYPGDIVNIAPTSTGKLKVVEGANTTAPQAVILFNPKKTSYVAGDFCTVLLSGGVVNEVTADAVNAGDPLYYNTTDGSVTKTNPGSAIQLGIAMAAVTANASGTLIPVLVG